MLRTLISLSLILSGLQSKAGLFDHSGYKVHFDLEALCQQCGEQVRTRMVSDGVVSDREQFSEEHPILEIFNTMSGSMEIPKKEPNKEVILIAPRYLGEVEQRQAQRFLDAIKSTEYGSNILNKLNGRQVGVKLFFDIPLKNGQIDWQTPMWITERRSVHELFGTFYFTDNTGWVALNNYQTPSDGVFTYIHELFHLLDGNDKIGDDTIDTFLAEYRAVLAEMVVFKSFKKTKTAFHKKLLSMFGNIDHDKIYDYVLDLYYPDKIEYFSEGKNTYQHLRDMFAHFERNRDDHNDNPMVHMKFTTDPILIHQQIQINQETRAYIKDYFNRNGKKLLDSTYINIIRNEGFNDTGIAGPRPRSTGGR